MSNATTLRPVVTPRRAPARAPAARGFFGSLWLALEAIGHARGRAELVRLADRVAATRPEFAAQLRQAAKRGWL